MQILQAIALISYLMKIFPPDKYWWLYGISGAIYKIVRDKYGLSQSEFREALEEAKRLRIEGKKIPIDEQIPPALGRALLREAGWVEEEGEEEEEDEEDDDWDRRRRRRRRRRY